MITKFFKNRLTPIPALIISPAAMIHDICATQKNENNNDKSQLKYIHCFLAFRSTNDSFSLTIKGNPFD
jgi:hypothetical protein